MYIDRSAARTDSKQQRQELTRYGGSGTATECVNLTAFRPRV